MPALPAPALAFINHVLAGNDWAKVQLAPFAGRSARIDLPPFDVAFTIASDGGIAATTAADTAADVTIRLPGASPLMLLQGMESLMRSLRLEGSVDFAQALGFVVRHVRWDAEEDLARLLGDIAAHRVAGGARQLLRWHNEALRNLGENLAEYFTEEQPLIVRKHEVAEFCGAVHGLRDDIARTRQRLDRLASRRS